MPKFLNDVDFNKNQLQNTVIHPSATAPSNPKQGQIYFNTTDNNIYRYDGTQWVTYQNELDTAATGTISIDSAPVAASSKPSSPCRGAALSRGLSCFFAFCCDGAPQLSQGDGKSVGVTCSCLRWGNIIAALTLLTRYWVSVKHKWQGEQSKTEKEKWRVAGLLQVSPVIKSVYSLHVNLGSHN